jgi:adenylate cyclase
MRATREVPSTPPYRALLTAAGARLRAVLALPFFARVGDISRRLAEAGTAPYPPDVRRRLKILNMMAYLIAATTFLYAVQQSLMDFHTFAPMILINLALVATALMVPFSHRFS